jgi:alpha-N-arabinofuranosidase
MRAEYAADINRRYATFANTPREMGTLKIASGSHDDNYDFAETMMRDGGRFDGLSVHYYTVPRIFRDKGPALGFPESEWTSTLQHARHIDEIVSKTAAIMDKYDPQKKVGLYVDEWGTWYDPAPGSNPGFLVQQNSLRDAEVAALSLNIFQRHSDRVRGANIAQMINVLQAMIMTDGPKMVLTPTYHVYKLYVPFQDATFVPVKFDAGEYKYQDVTMPRLDAVAARDKAGKLWLAVTNIDPNRPAEIAVAVEGARAGTVTGQVLTAATVDAVNTFAAPNAVAPKPIAGSVSGGTAHLTLPPKSIAVVALN